MTNERQPRVSGRDVIVPYAITRDQAIERLHRALASTYAVTSVPGDDQLYIRRRPLIYAVVTVTPLSVDRTRFRVSPDTLAVFQWVFGRLISAKRVARTIDKALE